MRTQVSVRLAVRRVRVIRERAATWGAYVSRKEYLGPAPSLPRVRPQADHGTDLLPLRVSGTPSRMAKDMRRIVHIPLVNPLEIYAMRLALPSSSARVRAVANLGRSAMP